MNRLSQYFELVPLWSMPLVLFAAFLAFTFIPAHRRMHSAISLQSLVLGLAVLGDSIFVASLAKVGSGLLLLVVIGLALWHPGKKRHLPPFLWLLPLLAALSVLYVLNVGDAVFAVVLQAELLLVFLAALAVARTVNTLADARAVFRSLSVGLVGFIIYLTVAMFSDYSNAALWYNGRLWLYGANPNQLGMVLAVGIVLSPFLFAHTKGLWVRLSYAGIVCCAIVILVMTGSRQSILLVVLILAPSGLLFVGKNLVGAIVVAAVASVAVFGIFGELVDEGEFRGGRILSVDQEGRYDNWGRWFRFTTENQIGFGVLERQEAWMFNDPAIPGFAHSAYLYWFYIGGLSLLLPMLFLIGWATFRAFGTMRALIARSDLRHIDVIYPSAFMVAVPFGMVNRFMFYPTHLWSLVFGVALSMVTLKIIPIKVQILKRGSADAGVRSHGLGSGVKDGSRFAWRVQQQFVRPVPLLRTRTRGHRQH